MQNEPAAQNEWTKEYITVKEAAQHFRVDGLTIRRAIHAGRLPAIRIGIRGAFRISRNAVEAFVARNSTVSPDDAEDDE